MEKEKQTSRLTAIMRRKKLKPTLRSIYHSPKYQPKVVLTRLTLATISKYRQSNQKKDLKTSNAPTPKALPLPPRRKISIDLLESRSVQENVVSSGSSVQISRSKRKASTASHSDDQEVSVAAVGSKTKSVRLKSSSSGRESGGTIDVVCQVNVGQLSRQGSSTYPPRGAVSSTSNAKKGNYEEDGFLNSADDTSSCEGNPDESRSRPWPTPKIVSVSSMAIPDSQARQRVRKPLLSSRDEAASSSETASELEESSSLPQPTTTTTSSLAKEKAPASPPAKVMRLANDADDTVPEAEVPQSAQLDFWENQKLVATLGKSLVTLQNVVTEVTKATALRSTQIAPEGRSKGVQQTICDPRCVELQRTLAALGIADEIFVKLAGIISDSQPGTEFYNPKAAVIMNLIQDYTSLY